MDMRLKLLLGLLLIVVGMGVEKYLTPDKVVTKTVIDTKTVTVIQHDTKTVTVIKPDGTKVISVVDRSVDTTKSKIDEVSIKIVENNKPQWKASIQLAGKNIKYEYFYGVQIERRILGPVFIGAFGNTDKTLGLSIGVEL